MPADEFKGYLARGGIHPRGVVLNSEFYELPLALNSSRLQEEVDALLRAGQWEQASAENAAQGVSSRHFRLTRSRHGPEGDLMGPFEEVGSLLADSPYIRSVLMALGGVVGNVALMSLEKGSEVEPHFDTNSYWYPRVRVHIPVRSNKKVVFSCGQADEIYKLRMKPGKAYLFDNHLGHSVKNAGKATRIHLAVDLVGSRKFWRLVSQGKKIGSQPKKATIQAWPVHEVADAVIATEAWGDATIKNCSDLVEAAAATAGPLRLEAAAREVVEEWCANIQQRQGEHRAGRRKDEVRQLHQLAAARACSMDPTAGDASPGKGYTGLAEVLDSVVELHRLGEADLELPSIGGEVSHGVPH